MAERLIPRNIERGLWKGPDIVTTKSVVINHYEKVPVVITKENLPFDESFYQYGTRWLMDYFVARESAIYPSVRSRYAQLGLNIDNGLVKQIGEWLHNNSHLDEKAGFLNSIVPFITVENRGSRPVILDKDAHLFRFFKEGYGSYLQDDELVEAVSKSGLIKIQGERLGDWVYSYGQVPGRKLPRPTGIFIEINPEGRGWIPPHPDKAIHIPDSGENYREIIDSLFEPIPKEQTKKILWIGETIKVTLDPSIDAVLDTVAIRGIKNDRDFTDESTWGIQLNSRIIDGGRTDWAIRTEIISQTSPDKIPNFVHLRFIKGSKFRLS